MGRSGQVAAAMIEYEQGNVHRINHFLKVTGFARTIGELTGLSPEDQETLEIAALTHDIGIKPSEEKYQSSDGVYQQMEGPPQARPMLEKLGCPPEQVERVCWLIAHHHDYPSVVALDHQILVEADFLVNAFEGNASVQVISRMRDSLFRTAAGRLLLEQLYGPLG